MKKLFILVMVVAAVALSSQHARAQAWQKNSKVLSIGMGVSQFFHIDDVYYYPKPPNVRGWYNLYTGQFNFQGEFGIHDYVGIGFTTGMGGRAGWGRGYRGELNIPMGIVSNFHFYQLIADNASKNIHADKLDIYAGANAGSGPAFIFHTNGNHIVPMVFGGLHAGIRYYFVPKVALNGEIGFGKSFINGGFSFKL